MYLEWSKKHLYLYFCLHFCFIIISLLYNGYTYQYFIVFLLSFFFFFCSTKNGFVGTGVAVLSGVGLAVAGAVIVGVGIDLIEGNGLDKTKEVFDRLEKAFGNLWGNNER